MPGGTAGGSATGQTRGARSARRGRRLVTGALPGLAVTALVLLLHILNPPFVAELGNLTFDAWQRASPRPWKDAAVRIVDIDDESIRRLGQWPWPRTDIARLNDRIGAAGAASISYDIVFSEPDRTSPARIAQILKSNPEAHGDYAEIARLPDHDVLLGRAFSRTPSVLGFFLTPDANAARPAAKAGFAVTGTAPLSAIPDFRGAIVPLPTISKDAAGSGFVSIPGGGDGIVRAAPLVARIGDQLQPSLSVEALRTAQGAGAVILKSSDASGEGGGGSPSVTALKIGQFQVPTTRAGELWMWYAKPRSDRTVAAWKILTGALSDADMKRLFDGHIVLVGTGASGLRDLVSTPMTDRALGVSVHAEALEQIISSQYLTRPDWGIGLERALILVLGVVMAFASASLGALRGGIAAAVAVIAGVGGSWLAFKGSALLLDPTLPALGVVLVYIAGTLVSFLREERARAWIHHAFDRYLSPELVERIARDPGQLELGGEEREMTVMFSDIRSFSRLSESLSPQEIIRFLIAFLTPMTDVLLARKATIDKYIGDAVLAFWNAPLDDPDHERNAALAALDMVARLEQLNAEAPTRSDVVWPRAVEIGIGLGSGLACVGNMGSSQRLNYSLIGDTVNVASRLEGLTKLYGATIMANEKLASALKDFALIELDLVRVVGRDRAERIFGLIGDAAMAATPAFRRLAEHQAALLEAYRAQHWDAAEAALKALQPDAAAFGLNKLCDLFASRIARFRTQPPGQGWDGVFEATEK